MSGSKCRRAVKLKVALVEEILDSLRSARSRSGLGGLRHKGLAMAHDELAEARRRAKNDVVQVPLQTVVNILNCFAISQLWFTELVGEFAESGSQK